MPEINAAFERLEPAMLDKMPLRLTPKDVRRIGAIEKKKRPKNPGSFVPRHEVRMNPYSGAEAMINPEFKWKVSAGKIDTWNAGLYRGGLKFPDRCAACMKEASRRELVQFTIRKFHPGRYGITVKDKDRAERMWDAWTSDRFWYAIPFCDEHGLDSRSIVLEEKQSREFLFGFTNQEFGKQVSLMNGISGGWLDKNRLIRRMIYVLLSAFCSLPIFLGALFVVTAVKGGLGERESQPFDLPLGILMLIAGIGLLVLFLRLHRRNVKGLDLTGPEGDAASQS